MYTSVSKISQNDTPVNTPKRVIHSITAWNWEGLFPHLASEHAVAQDSCTHHWFKLTRLATKMQTLSARCEHFLAWNFKVKISLSLKRHIAHKWAKIYHISLKAAAIKCQYKYLHSHNHQTADHYHNVQMFYTAPIYTRTSSPKKDN